MGTEVPKTQDSSGHSDSNTDSDNSSSSESSASEWECSGNKQTNARKPHFSVTSSDSGLKLKIAAIPQTKPAKKPIKPTVKKKIEKPKDKVGKKKRLSESSSSSASCSKCSSDSSSEDDLPLKAVKKTLVPKFKNGRNIIESDSDDKCDAKDSKNGKDKVHKNNLAVKKSNDSQESSGSKGQGRQRRIPGSEDWKRIEHGFRTKWNFPGCVGALDGKHINIFAPDDTSDYYNYKGAHSIILLALVDDDYCFSYVNVGTNGRASDGGVYQKSNLAQALENNTLNFPDQSVIVADAAFPLKSYLMKPYRTTPTRKEKIFNYRLSRARRIVENGFGILVTRFRVFMDAIDMAPKNVDRITLAACSLHNWLRKTSDMYITQRCVDFEDTQQRVVVPGSWRAQLRTALEGLPPTRYANHASRQAEAIRDTYAQLFETTEAVPWQGHMI